MKKYLSIFCLMIYLLFGFLNTGCVGFCAGMETYQHFGLNLFGYETCCHHKITSKTSSMNSSSKIIKACKCNDVFAQTSDIVQNSDIQTFDFETLSLYMQYPQLIAYHINSTNKISPHNNYSSKIFLSSDRLKLKSTVLKI